MQKIALLVLGLALFINLSRQDCDSPVGDCVYYSQNCTDLEAGKCCRTAAEVLALASATARACAFAYASAHASAYACVQAQAYTSAAACATAHVCIIQSVGLSINTGRCCEVSSSIAANASSYASAIATATSSAYARAAAAATASANAAAAASAAASLYTFAKTVIESSCCQLNLRIINTVEAVGNFSSQASVAAEACVQAAVSLKACSDSCAFASDSVKATTAVFLSGSINNCCKSNTTRLLAQNSSAACNAIVDKQKDLFSKTEDALDGLVAGIDHIDEIVDPVELQSLLCTPECKDAIISCCYDNTCGCAVNPDTCCAAGEVYTLVSLETHAIVSATAGALAYAAVYVQVTSGAFAAIRVAAYAAANATLIVDVNVKSCCSIVVTVSTTATSIASAIGKAFAAARACAEAAAGAQGQAFAIAYAVGNATADGFAFARLSYQGCCGQPCCLDQSCCEIANLIASKSANATEVKTLEDSQECVKLAQDSTGAFSKSRETETARVISIVSTQTAFLLQCCCCTTAAPTVTTKKVSFSSTLSFGFGFGK